MTQFKGNMLDTGKKTKLSSLLVLFIFLPFLFLAITYLVSLVRSVSCHNDTTYPEAASVYAFLTSLRTGNLYSDPFQLPLNVQTYGPIFYLIGSMLAKIAHGDPVLTAELARALSLLSFLASIGLVGLICWRLEGQKRSTAIIIVLGLACSWAVPVCVSARSDALSIIFILAALTVYELAQGRSRFIFWVGVLGSLSWLTKQSTAPLILAPVIDALIDRRFRNTGAIIAGSLPVPALVVSAMWLRHEPFLANFLALGHAVYSRTGAFVTALAILRTDQIALIPISIALLGAALSWRKTKYRATMLATVFATLSSLAALANTGGAGNYMILPWLLGILFVPAGLVRIEEWASRSVLIPVGLTLLGVLLVIHQRNFLPLRRQPDLDTYKLDRLKMLSASPYLEMYSREPQLMDPNFYHQLFLQNAWSIAPILHQIDDERYDLILIGGGDGPTDSDFLVQGFRGSSLWGAETIGEMESHYRALCEVPGFIALVPQDRSSVLQDSDITRIFRQPCLVTKRRLQLGPGMH